MPAHVQRSQKATLARRHWAELASRVAPQPEPVTRIRPRRVWLSVVEVSRHNQIEMAVTIHIVSDDCFDRGDLRQVRQRERAEAASTIVVQIDTGKCIRLVVDGLLQLGGAE